jgi:hypothetical protein
MEIEKLAKDFSEARIALKGKVDTLEDEIRSLKRRYLPGIKIAIEKAANCHMRLFDGIGEAPELFVKPKTVIFHGIKFGYQKGKGEIIYEDEAQVIKLIKKHFPDQVEELIKCKETPFKPALGRLSVADLKKIGVTVIDTGDEIYIKPTDSEIDKLINALLADEELAARAA